ncbi:MAG: hypothetical protein HY901_17040 [Deltaproteobacteria bacterium]|nr:hypothetical protein [Deltaproteobacteria bacterium]
MALAQKSHEAARLAVSDVLAVDPQSAGAQALATAIQRETNGSLRKGTGAPTPSPEDPTGKIIETFGAGRLDEAIGVAQSCDDPKCRALKDKLSAFRDTFNNLEGDGNAEKAASLLRSIPGGTGSQFWAKVSQVTTSTFIKDGLKAMSAENYPKAFAAFRKVQAVDPGNEVAKRNLGTIRQKAKELSEQAYIDLQQAPDKARGELELILQITEPSDELNTKSKNRLRKLQGGGAD